MSVIARSQSLLLAGFILSFVPLSLTCLCFNYALLALDIRPTLRTRLRRNRGFQQRNVLVTGTETPQGLHLARALAATGHNVIGASYGSKLLPVPASFSASLYRHYRLQCSLSQKKPPGYIQELLQLIQQHNIQLWVDCAQHTITSDLRQARTVIERRSRCLCFLPNDELMLKVSTREDFLAFARGHGLPALDNHQVTTRSEIHNVLNNSRGKKKYVLSGPEASPIRKILPRRTLSQTYNELSKLQIDDKRWNLKQHVEGQERYTTLSVVVRGELKCFTACPTSATGCFQALPPKSALNRALMSYASALCEKLGPGYTGHLSIDFCTDETASATGVEKAILPTDGGIGPDASILVFQNLHGSIDLSRAYLSFLAPHTNGVIGKELLPKDKTDREPATPTKTEKGFYSLGYDSYHLLLRPFMQLLRLKVGPRQVAQGWVMFLNHLVFWQECVYQFTDPLPFWWLYQVYIPVLLILGALHPKGPSLSQDTQLMIR